MIMSYSDRVLSFAAAAVSFKKRVIGDAAKLINAIPVYRTEDYKKKGKGSIKFLNKNELIVIF